ncbi:TetR family transcriptional regulator [Nocardia panacis]|uniref:TetR family transcriptional regulator n=1 Tax=Nocardia panacis TaxID=2340916 RepID=A0A3A4K5A2_9NOCA|nr:TetR family transcriptional regulator [Nocardia panacis]RJO73671.1 TetR family transcriptional regulator [Nocardia panacis]
MALPHEEAVGARIRAARQSRRISLRALAAMIEVSPATLSQIENGHTKLSVTRLHRIADRLGMSVTEILAADTFVAHQRDSPIQSDWRVYGRLEFDPVLRAALAEFLEVGYHGATVRGIATRADLSVSGIYHHYASKQQMLLNILEHTMSELLTRSKAARAAGRDPVERFCLLIENLALFHTHRRELGFVGAAEMRSLTPSNHRQIAARRNAQQRMVDHEVEQAVLAGHFRADLPHEAARSAVTLCTALPTWWRPGGPSGPEDIARQYVGFALDLLRASAR